MALGWRREERKAPPPAVSPLHPRNKHPTLLPPRNPRPQDTPQAETQSRSKDMMLWGLSNPDDDGFSAVIRSKVCGMPNPERAPFAGRVRKQREIPAADHSKSSAQSNKSPPSVAKGEEEERRLWSIEAEQRPPGPAPKPAGSELAGSHRRHQMRCAGLQNWCVFSHVGRFTKRAGREPPARWTNRDHLLRAPLLWPRGSKRACCCCLVAAVGTPGVSRHHAGLCCRRRRELGSPVAFSVG